ncbi:MAG: lysylphosphatidylglycerol synthase transmembrane domain-containing protein [Chthoniobacterales bacterium]
MKKTLITILQVAVTIAVLYLVFHDPNKRAQMALALRVADYRWIAAAIFCYVIVEMAAAARWHVLLQVQGIRLSAPRVTGLFFIGMFFNQFLPGGTGGDIIKSYYLLKETPGRKAGALLSVLFDRLIGLVALVTITAGLILVRYHWLAQTRLTRGYLWFVLAVLAVSVAALTATFLISGFNLASRLRREFPARERLIEISAAYHLYARHWTGTLIAFVLSLIAHTATFFTFLFVAYTLRANVRVLDFFAVMPIERTISAIPISFAGEGPREHVLQVMLSGLCGVAPGVAALIGTMSFVVILLCSAPGGIVYLFYRPSGVAAPVKLSEMKREVATLEHEIGETQ